MERSKNELAGTARRIGRRPYERPAIEETADFETLALTCAKYDGDFGCQASGGTTNS